MARKEKEMPIKMDDGSWTVTVQDCLRAVGQAAEITPTPQVVGGVVLCDGLHKIANVVEGDVYIPSEIEMNELMEQRGGDAPDPFIGYWYTTTRSAPDEYERQVCKAMVEDDDGAALLVICPTRVYLLDVEYGEVIFESPKSKS